MVSKTNMIKNLSIRSDISIKLIQDFVNLCPRLQHLILNKFPSSPRKFLQLLLPTSDNNTPNLVTLCVQYISETEINTMRRYIKSQKRT